MDYIVTHAVGLKVQYNTYKYMKTTTLGIFADRAGAENAIVRLNDIGLSNSNISYVQVNSNGEMIEKDTTGEAVAKGAAGGAGTGALIGGIAGLTVAAGIIPGLGALFIGGPLAAALGITGAAATTATGALTGAAAGGLIGALAALGVSNDDAEVYEERVKRGGILLMAQTDEGVSARDAFIVAGADEVREYTKV